MTVKQILQEASEFGKPYSRAMLFDGTNLKADYDNVSKLADGTWFDSCLEVKTYHSVGRTLIAFVDLDSFPISGVNSFMSTKRRKWLSYTVTHKSVSVTLNDGTVIEGRDFNAISKKP